MRTLQTKPTLLGSKDSHCRMSDLGGFAASLWYEVLSLVAFIKDDKAIIVWASPVNKLLQACVALVTGAGQAGVCQENDTLLHTNLDSICKVADGLI